MGEIICKPWNWQGVNLQNIQTAHAAQYQKTENPMKKWADINRHFFKEDIWLVKKHKKRCSPLSLNKYKSKLQWDISSHWWESVQFSSVTQSCLTLCNPINWGTPGLPVHHHLPEFTQTHVHRVGDAIQPSHPLWSPSPPAHNPSQHQGLFKWVNSSHEVAKVLEFQLQHQSFQRTPRTDIL